MMSLRNIVHRLSWMSLKLNTILTNGFWTHTISKRHIVLPLVCLWNR